MTQTGATTVNRRSILRAGAGGLAAATVGVAGAACGGPDTSGGKTGPSTDIDYAGVTPAASIDFWSVHPGRSQEVETEIVQAYNDSQSDTVVKLVTAGGNYDDVTQKLQAAQVSNTLPGVVTLGFWISFCLTGQLQGLNPLMSEVGLEVDDYYDALFFDYELFDTQWAIPYARSTPLFYYNKDHFAQAGLPDRAPESWMEFADWAPKLKSSVDSSVKHAFEYGSPTDQPTWGFECNVWGWGGAYSREFEPTSSSPETVAAYEWGRKSIFEDKWAGVAPSSCLEDFAAGATSATVTSTGALRAILDTAKFEVGTGFLPGGEKVSRDEGNLCPTGGASLAVPAGIEPEEQLAAMNFIKFLTSPENTVKFSAATGYMPLRKSADTTSLVKATPQAETAIDQLPHARNQAARKLFPGGSTVLNEAHIECFTKQEADPREVMARADQELQSIYDADIEPYLPENR